MLSCSSANSNKGRNCFFILFDFYNFHIGMYSKIIVYLIALMYIKEMCTYQRRQIRWLTSD